MKKILFGIIILSISMSFKIENHNLPAENGKLSGIAIFRDAYKSSDQADAGCEIYAIHESDVKSTRYDDLKGVVERFQGYKYDYLLSLYYSIDPARNKTFRDNFDTVSDLTDRFIRRFKKLPSIVRAATSEAGNYTLSLKPGRYYILFISGSVKSDNNAELKGNIGYKIVEIKSSTETTQNVKFLKQELTGILPVKNLSGC